ncbi:MAG: citrate lyase holo-[acyl-carrier protein] synthase [Spirochaetaceae bacterium]|nr:citrate lyase holo-[acyl-carrier protein] synthase [Spirochaetaceae bacterium]
MTALHKQLGVSSNTLWLAPSFFPDIIKHVKRDYAIEGDYPMSTVDVYDMATARELRGITQKKMIEQYHSPLISFSLNIPGPEKDNTLYRKIHRVGEIVIEKAFAQHIIHRISQNGKTGPQAYYAIKMPSPLIKKETVKIEENHPYGRIFDIDVIDLQCKPISREKLNIPGRKCFICEEEAALCSRSRKHGVEELLQKIHSIAEML